FAPKQARKPDAKLYSSLVKNTTTDVASYALDLLGPIESGAVVHDNGCGCLEATRALLSKTAGDITIEATDIDPAMLARAKEIVQAEKWSTVRVHRMPAEQLSFPDSHFSHSISNILIFMTRNDGLDCAKEIFRTLKPGGKAAVTTWATMPHSKAVDDVHHALRGDEAALRFVMPERWWTASHLESVLRQGGFDRTEVKTCEVELRIDEGELRDQAEMIWSLRGMPEGGWTSGDEENWDKAIDLLVERMKATSHDKSAGGAVFKMVANVAICTK
ncbi:S-adenosyl-L-methionine-dependent methyltransferase, partial [Westerdykella ornata]